MATQVKEHYPNPKVFLKVFHHTLDSFYTDPPHCPSKPIPDIFREKSPIPSAPAIPRPKTTFTKGTNPSPEDTLLLCQLLNDKGLEIPVLTYCQPSSPLLTLYQAYQVNHWLKNLRTTDYIIYKQETDLVNTFHHLDGFSFLQELYHLPLHYATSRESFCLSCYHVGHYQQDCVHYKCVSCLHWQPGHKALTCPCNYQPTSHPPPHCSPCIQKKNSSSSTSFYQSNPTRPRMVKKPKQGSFTRPIPIPSPEEKGKQQEEWDLLEKLVDEICEDPTFTYNNDTLANITREPYVDFWIFQWNFRV